jgi:hypothetical protein
VIDEDAITDLETSATGAGLDNLTGGLVAGDDSAIAFGTFAEMLVIDAADVGPADGGRLDGEKDFAVRRLWH